MSSTLSWGAREAMPLRLTQGAFLSPHFDFGGGKAQFGENLLGVLAQGRGRRRLQWGLAEVGQGAHHPQGSQVTVL